MKTKPSVTLFSLRPNEKFQLKKKAQHYHKTPKQWNWGCQISVFPLLEQ